MSAEATAGEGVVHAWSGIGLRLRAALDAWAARYPMENGGPVRTLAADLRRRGVRGSTAPSIYTYLNGEVLPPLEFAVTAADVLGVEFDWLVRGRGPQRAAGPAGGSIVSRIAVVLELVGGQSHLSRLLAERGVRGGSRTMLKMYCCGAVAPPIEWIQAAAEVAGCSAGWLAFGVDCRCGARSADVSLAGIIRALPSTALVPAGFASRALDEGTAS